MRLYDPEVQKMRYTITLNSHSGKFLGKPCPPTTCRKYENIFGIYNNFNEPYPLDGQSWGGCIYPPMRDQNRYNWLTLYQAAMTQQVTMDNKWRHADFQKDEAIPPAGVHTVPNPPQRMVNIGDDRHQSGSASVWPDNGACAENFVYQGRILSNTLQWHQYYLYYCPASSSSSGASYDYSDPHNIPTALGCRNRKGIDGRAASASRYGDGEYPWKFADANGSFSTGMLFGAKYWGRDINDAGTQLSHPLAWWINGWDKSLLTAPTNSVVKWELPYLSNLPRPEDCDGMIISVKDFTWGTNWSCTGKTDADGNITYPHSGLHPPDIADQFMGGTDHPSMPTCFPFQTLGLAIMNHTSRNAIDVLQTTRPRPRYGLPVCPEYNPNPTGRSGGPYWGTAPVTGWSDTQSPADHPYDMISIHQGLGEVDRKQTGQRGGGVRYPVAGDATTTNFPTTLSYNPMWWGSCGEQHPLQCVAKSFGVVVGTRPRMRCNWFNGIGGKTTTGYFARNYVADRCANARQFDCGGGVNTDGAGVAPPTNDSPGAASTWRPYWQWAWREGVTDAFIPGLGRNCGNDLNETTAEMTAASVQAPLGQQRIYVTPPTNVASVNTAPTSISDVATNVNENIAGQDYTKLKPTSVPRTGAGGDPINLKNGYNPELSKRLCTFQTKGVKLPDNQTACVGFQTPYDYGETAFADAGNVNNHGCCIPGSTSGARNMGCWQAYAEYHSDDPIKDGVYFPYKSLDEITLGIVDDAGNEMIHRYGSSGVPWWFVPMMSTPWQVSLVIQYIPKKK